MSNLQKYGSYSPEQARKALDDANKGSTEMHKLVGGTNKLRLMPPKTNGKEPFIGRWQHFVRIPGRLKVVIFNCPRMMARRSCPACLKGDAMKAKGNEEDYKAAKDLGLEPRQSYIWQAVNRKEEEAGVRPLSVPPTVHKEFLAFLDPDQGGGDMLHPVAGFDVYVKKTGQNLSTEYKTTPARDNSPLHEDAAEAEIWLESLVDLDKYARVLPDQKLKEMLAGEGQGRRGGTDAEEEEAPARRAPKARNAMDDVIETEGEAVED